MNLTKFSELVRVVALGSAVLFAGVPANLLADTFSISYLNPGVQAPNNLTSYETFDNVSVNNGVLTTTFNGSGVTGTYSGGFAVLAATIFGGAQGTSFISTEDNVPFTLTLSQGVNYFGLWFSALDRGNNISFYNGNALVESFSAANYSALVGTCSNAANPYCGNPNNGANAFEQYAYLNFFDIDGSFDRIVFTESPQTGQLESDNHAVARLSQAPGGTLLSADAPEPDTLLLASTGVLGLMGVLRYRVIRSR
jgi:hypothetical protein